ncbi:TPA: hypothetical protein ACWSQU_002150 [Klebsiella pneumoniae]|uniref:hypothetical protein n=1 Tax=Klebsiella pneumoniae TaxID=573 RepID=UPI00117D7E37|nr:hypothetical protein [Klebsiella pneumoniae]MBW2951018.1 hypothetical protein [Klebsiella pneumoniae]QWT00213.1 hypothetical protein FOH49_023825 [Klebsiella pneumoniae]QWT05289.1 hypothetical protein FOH48_023770 [Klebsiella pneumoniae]QWT10351.1 hypothetical protein FOH51_023770 [Klebsiella pneumoniae]HBQ1334877.1 hypothetical protein [Klebsiella pneumoniae]
MAKPAKIDFATENAQTIADAILNGVTNIQNLKAFRYRVGTDKADKLYPQTREAMNLVNAERKKARDRQVFKDLLRPFSQKYAAGATIPEILAPVLKGYRQMYLEKLGLDLTHEQIIMLLVATTGVEQLEKYGYSVIGDFPTATTTRH